MLKCADYFADPVGSTIVHNSGTVVATCSGQRSIPDFEDTDSSSEEGESADEATDDGDEFLTRASKATARTPDNSLKVWSL